MIAAIELAVLERLRAMEAVLGFAWKRRLTLPDDWEAYLDSKGGEIVGPAAWIGFTGWTETERSNDQLIVDATFGLLLGNTSDRQDEAANRHGGPDAAKEPGSYRLALGAAAILSGQMLGLDLSAPIEVGACQPMPRSAKMKALRLSVHALILTCRFPIQLSGDDGPDALMAMHVNWDVPAYNSPFPVDRDPVAPGAQLPDDFHADATDHLIFEEPDA